MAHEDLDVEQAAELIVWLRNYLGDEWMRAQLRQRDVLARAYV